MRGEGGRGPKSGARAEGWRQGGVGGRTPARRVRVSVRGWRSRHLTCRQQLVHRRALLSREATQLVDALRERPEFGLLHRVLLARLGEAEEEAEGEGRRL